MSSPLCGCFHSLRSILFICHLLSSSHLAFAARCTTDTLSAESDSHGVSTSVRGASNFEILTATFSTIHLSSPIRDPLQIFVPDIEDDDSREVAEKYKNMQNLKLMAHERMEIPLRSHLNNQRGVRNLEHSTTQADPLQDRSKPVLWGFGGEALDEGSNVSFPSSFSDSLSVDEVKRRQMLLGITISLGLGGIPTSMGPTAASMNGSFYRWDSVKPPVSVDWRVTDAITLVKSQGQCASCWAIATADVISMMWGIAQGHGRRAFNTQKSSQAATSDGQFGLWGASDVSAQETCDCGLGSCCQPGWPEWAFSYVLDNGGVSSWQSYPFFQQEGNCSASLKAKKMAAITGWELIPPRSPEAAMKAVAQQPFVTLISAGSASFQAYSGGVYDGDCGDELDHVVVVVGYGTSSQFGPYWIIKNSWGTLWGDNGYMYLAMRSGKGKCSMHAAPALFPFYYPLNVRNDNPCARLPNPCGAGTCYTVVTKISLLPLYTLRAPRCSCPAGYVEHVLSSPPKCVRSDPCGANPGPCGMGSCSNLKDGSYVCSCAQGYFVGSRADGSPTCVAGNQLIGGLLTITALLGNTIQGVAKLLGVLLNTLLSLNVWVSSPVVPLPAGAVIAIGGPNASTIACTANYIVQSGDSCLKVASLYQLSLWQLQNLNPLLTCQLLLPGTELCVKQGSLANSSATAVPRCAQLYEVKSGDTCEGVRVRSGISLDLFKTLNPGLKCDKPLDVSIVVCTAAESAGGGVVNCSKQYRVQHGDSCASVWLGQGLTYAQFRLLNPGVRCTAPYFQVGQLLCVNSTLLSSNAVVTTVPHLVQSGDTIASISDLYIDRCGGSSTASAICVRNAIPGCGAPEPGTMLQIPCDHKVSRTCGCDNNYDPVFGSDGIWYQNYCSLVCNYALPALSKQSFCKRACMNRAGLSPYNDPNRYCSSPCPWPQWNPQPANWWRIAKTFCQYYVGACQDWCSSSANTVCKSRNDWDNWRKYYSDCTVACRRGKC